MRQLQLINSYISSSSLQLFVQTIEKCAKYYNLVAKYIIRSCLFNVRQLRIICNTMDEKSCIHLKKYAKTKSKIFCCRQLYGYKKPIRITKSYRLKVHYGQPNNGVTKIYCEHKINQQIFTTFFIYKATQT